MSIVYLLVLFGINLQTNMFKLSPRSRGSRSNKGMKEGPGLKFGVVKVLGLC